MGRVAIVISDRERQPRGVAICPKAIIREENRTRYLQEERNLHLHSYGFSIQASVLVQPDRLQSQDLLLDCNTPDVFLWIRSFRLLEKICIMFRWI